ILASGPSLAQVTCPAGASTWVGGSGNSWTTAANWNPVGVPGTGLLVGADGCFNTTATPVLPGFGTFTLRSLNFLSAAAVTISGGGLFTLQVGAGGISADGNFTIGGVRLAPTANQTWTLNSFGNVINSPLQANPSTVVITSTGAGDVTLAGLSSAF